MCLNAVHVLVHGAQYACILTVGKMILQREKATPCQRGKLAGIHYIYFFLDHLWNPELALHPIPLEHLSPYLHLSITRTYALPNALGFSSINSHSPYPHFFAVEGLRWTKLQDASRRAERQSESAKARAQHLFDPRKWKCRWWVHGVPRGCTHVLALPSMGCIFSVPFSHNQRHVLRLSTHLGTRKRVECPLGYGSAKLTSFCLLSWQVQSSASCWRERADLPKNWDDSTAGLSPRKWRHSNVKNSGMLPILVVSLGSSASPMSFAAYAQKSVKQKLTGFVGGTICTRQATLLYVIGVEPDAPLPFLSSLRCSKDNCQCFSAVVNLAHRSGNSHKSNTYPTALDVNGCSVYTTRTLWFMDIYGRIILELLIGLTTF